MSSEEDIQPRIMRRIESSCVGCYVVLDSKSYTDIQKYYNFIKVLGSGRYGTVREAAKKGMSPALLSNYAVKSLSKADIAQDLMYYRRELEILMHVDHPNIVNFFEVYEDEAYIHIVMELCSGGDLFDHLNLVGSFSEQAAVEITKQLISAINHLHTMKVCHRDLKPENFMYLDTSKRGGIKLVDFGLAKRWKGTQLMKSKVGSPYFVAPEVMTGNYDFRCDVWSLGVVLYLLLCGQPPFLGNNATEVYNKSKEGVVVFDSKVWLRVSDHAKDLICKMLVVNPHDRITLSQAAGHPFFRTFSQPIQSWDERILTNIQNWQAPEMFQKEVLKIMMKFSTPTCIEQLNTSFAMLDSSGTGFVSVEEVVTAFNELGKPLAATQVAELKEKFQGNRINYSEFLIAAADKKRVLDDAALHVAFKFFDFVTPKQNDKGYLTMSSISVAFQRIGISIDPADICETMLWGENSRITFEDFKAMMLQLVRLNSNKQEGSFLESFLILSLPTEDN